MVTMRSLLLLTLSTFPVAESFNYFLTTAGSIVLNDVATGIQDIQVLFNTEAAYVTVTELEWEQLENTTISELLRWQTFVGDTLSAEGVYNLTDFGRQLPSVLDVGNVTVDSAGTNLITVKLIGEGYEVETEETYMSYAAGVSIIPLCVVLVLAMGTQMVEFSLFVTIFIGACMVAGEVNQGFKDTLEVYILRNLADVDHGYVFLFSLFLSGLVAMMQKSGGMIGFTTWVAQYAKTPRAAQVSVFCVTLLCFFDDYTNLLLTGQSMSGLADSLMVSKEKLTFLVDATAAPLASLTPVSSWVGFEVNLIQQELDNLINIYGEENLTISTSAIQVFLQSIKYRYYPIFMLFLIPALLIFQKDFGPMLYAERRVRIYERTDGGDGAVEKSDDDEGTMAKSENAPDSDIPYKTYNMLVPVLLLIFFIFYLLVQTGDDGSGTQSFTEKIENSNSFSALLWGTMATSILTILMYWAQIVQDGRYVLPTLPVLKSCLCGISNIDNDETTEDNDKAASDPTADPDNEGEEKPSTDESQALIADGPGRARSLMSIYESVESYLFGMGRLFPALIVLTLAWATGDIMTTVGADRFFSRVITGGVAAEAMPTLSFIIAVLMALATGSSWSTMTILFPLIMVPTYEVSGGDELIFYSTVAGVLSGSVAGDHMSPISDTTVISAMSCGCKLVNHVVTQAPYSTLVVIICVLFGTIPIGYSSMPNIVGILLGLAVTVLWVFLCCAPAIHPSGRYDVITELFMCCKKNEYLQELREETVRYSEGHSPEATDDNENENENEKTVEGDVDAKEAPVDGAEEEPTKKVSEEEPAPEPVPNELEAEVDGADPVKVSQLSHLSC